MKKILNNNLENIGWNFDNSYNHLPKILMHYSEPCKATNPNIVILNDDLSANLGLNFSDISNYDLSQLFSGNYLPKDSKTISQAYAGHQFGNFTMLGDGRATMLGEHITPNQKRFDIQFKGSGITPYSRNGDGRAAIGPMMREYLISESMYGLNIPTTRSLAVATTGEIINREKPVQGAILTRIASSHIRIGTFQFLSMKGDNESLKKLVAYSLKRHFSNTPIDINPAITLLKCVIEKQITLINHWMRVGYVMGVINSDNVAISGETIDYGPCAFMNAYNPSTVFSSIDTRGRYSFGNQPLVTHWNLSRFAETLIPLLDTDENKALKIGESIINDFGDQFKGKWLKMMGEKLGFFENKEGDEIIIKNLLKWMEENKADYNNTFHQFMNITDINNKIFNKDSFKEILNKRNNRLIKNKQNLELSNQLMRSRNPLIIPRNHIVEESLDNIVNKNDIKLFNLLLENMKNPYEDKKINERFKKPSNKIYEENYQTFCGT